MKFCDKNITLTKSMAKTPAWENDDVRKSYRWFQCVVSWAWLQFWYQKQVISVCERNQKMGKMTFRVVIAILVVLLLYYVGRPLYWKISATVHDIRHNKQTVSGGISSQLSLSLQSLVQSDTLIVEKKKKNLILLC